MSDGNLAKSSGWAQRGNGFSKQRVLIVGQGLAGTLLAENLLRRGQEVLVLEAGDPDAASRVAPGIINPLAGKKLKPSWEVRVQLSQALEIYGRLGELLGATFFHSLPIIRVIKDETQAGFFRQRQSEAEAKPFIGTAHSAGSLDRRIRDPFGSFVAVGSGYLDTGALVSGFGDYLRREGRLREEVFQHAKLARSGNGWIYGGEPFASVVFCEGWRGRDNPFLGRLPFNPAKGEMLDIVSGQAVDLPQGIINRGKWLLPLGEGRFRAGATYSWDPLDTEPTLAAREEILQMLGEYLEISFEVVNQRAGVRPIMRDYRPVLGGLPGEDGLFVLNGLGSKGVLSAPWLAEVLALHMVEGHPVPGEAEVGRFFR